MATQEEKEFYKAIGRHQGIGIALEVLKSDKNFNFYQGAEEMLLEKSDEIQQEATKLAYKI